MLFLQKRSYFNLSKDFSSSVPALFLLKATQLYLRLHSHHLILFSFSYFMLTDYYFLFFILTMQKSSPVFYPRLCYCRCTGSIHRFAGITTRLAFFEKIAFPCLASFHFIAWIWIILVALIAWWTTHVYKLCPAEVLCCPSYCLTHWHWAKVRDCDCCLQHICSFVWRYYCLFLN